MRIWALGLASWKVYRLYAMIVLAAVLGGMLFVFYDAATSPVPFATTVYTNLNGESLSETVLMVSSIPYILIALGSYVLKLASWLCGVL